MPTNTQTQTQTQTRHTHTHTRTCCGAVLHQIEFTIGWNKRDGSVRVKLAEFDTLMKCQVINGNGVLLAVLLLLPTVLLRRGFKLLCCFTEHVVDAEFAVWHARELCVCVCQ